MDIVAQTKAGTTYALHTSNLGQSIRQQWGGKMQKRKSILKVLTNVTMIGVGRNIAECLARLNSQVALASAIGDDLFGKQLLQHAKRLGIVR